MKKIDFSGLYGLKLTVLAALVCAMSWGVFAPDAVAQSSGSSGQDDEYLVPEYRGQNAAIREMSLALIDETGTCLRSRRAARQNVFRNVVRESERQLANTALSLQDIQYLAVTRSYGIVLSAACR